MSWPWRFWLRLNGQLIKEGVGFGVPIEDRQAFNWASGRATQLAAFEFHGGAISQGGDFQVVEVLGPEGQLQANGAT